MWEELIKIEGPYNFDLALDRLAMDPLHIIDRENRVIRVPVYQPSAEVVDVQALGTTETPEFLLKGKNINTKEKAIAEITRVFQWNTPLDEIHRHFSSTALSGIFSEHRGTPIVLEFSLHASIMRSIIHQQIHMKLAISLTKQFVKTHGFEVDGVPFFPLPETVAALKVEDLRKLRMSQRKAEYLIDVSGKMANGDLNLELVKKKSDREVITELVKLRGIGPWTAQSFLLFGLGRNNLFPKADIGLQNALKRLFQLDQKPGPEEIDLYINEWEPYLSYASLYLWRSIENK